METPAQLTFNRIFLIVLLFFFSSSPLFVKAQDDSSQAVPKVLLIPYSPMMHLSDSDQDISEGSQEEIGEMRQQLRKNLVAAINKQFAEVVDVKMPQRNFVGKTEDDFQTIYHSLYYEQDSTFPSKFPKLYGRKDTTLYISKTAKKPVEETVFINSGLRDKLLLHDLADKYGANYFIFLNEIDIKTHFDDCINLALKIYSRDLKVHYSIYDVSGKLVYGDVAVVHFPSNSNNVAEISQKTFPSIASQILRSFTQATTKSELVKK